MTDSILPKVQRIIQMPKEQILAAIDASELEPGAWIHEASRSRSESAVGCAACVAGCILRAALGPSPTVGEVNEACTQELSSDYYMPVHMDEDPDEEIDYDTTEDLIMCLLARNRHLNALSMHFEARRTKSAARAFVVEHFPDELTLEIYE